MTGSKFGQSDSVYLCSTQFHGSHPWESVMHGLDSTRYIPLHNNSLMERVPIEHLFERARYLQLHLQDGGLLQYVRDCKILVSLIAIPGVCEVRRRLRVVCGNGVRLLISKAGKDLATSQQGAFAPITF